MATSFTANAGNAEDLLDRMYPWNNVNNLRDSFSVTRSISDGINPGEADPIGNTLYLSEFDCAAFPEDATLVS